MKNAKKEFGKKAGKALGNAVFGVYGEDKRIGVRYEQGSARRSGSSTRPASQSSSGRRTAAVAKAEKEKRSMELRAAAKEGKAARITSKEKNVQSIDFEYGNAKQIVSQLTKLESIAVMAYRNDDRDDDGIGAAAISKYRTGLSMLKASNPKDKMIPHFESQLERLKSAQKKSGFATLWEDKLSYIAFFVIALLVLLVMGYF